MFWLFIALAHAQQLGVIEMPYTPSDGKTEYSTLAKVKGGSATGAWKADAAGFECAPLGEYVEVKITADRWPRVIPKAVTCTQMGGKGRARAKIRIREGRHESMLVSDGTLVLPRGPGASASWEGVVPVDGLVVGKGTTTLEGLTCEVVVGPKLVVRAGAGAKDGLASCSVRLSNGNRFAQPVHVVTVRAR